MNILTLHLNNNESIILSSHDSPDKMGEWDDIAIEYRGENSIYLTDSRGDEILRSAEELLTKTLNKELLLHESIKQDIGYLWNEELQGKPGLTYEEGSGNIYWIGERFLLWSCNSRLENRGTTWLYNDENGDIILEITPVYPWTFRDPKPNEKYVSYDEYMKSYKPLVIRKIPVDIAQEWLVQVKKLAHTIQESEKRMDPCEGCVK
jgi:hypothetical protein